MRIPKFTQTVLSSLVLWAAVPVLAGDVPIHSYSPTSPDPSCSASLACSSWLDFRRAHPWPIQTYALADTGREAVIVISEPPPSLTKPELASAVRSLFGSDLIELDYYRWPTGIDGWLEDLVAHVRLKTDARISAFSGDSLTPKEEPAEIVDRLSVLYRLQYQTTDGFWLADTKGAAGAAAIPDLKVPADELGTWLNDPKSSWTRVGTTSAGKTMRELLAEKAPGVFAREGGLIALVAPRAVKLADLEAPFRIFAVSTDLILGATGPQGGGLVLVGRERQLPLTLVPPLRFESFSTFARNRSAELAQSYERQRIFAGRIRDGQYQGWDWAPILLSPQLDDTEYGTLLNQADQILKSWSQHGDVDYLGFSYPKPGRYPFGDEAASDYFADEFNTSSLLFNWNTNHFATLTPTKTGDLLTVDRTGALEILYRPFGGLFGDEGADDPKENGALYRRVQAKADQAATSARNYFATRGDPILVRVVQNTLLYQAEQTFLRASDAQDTPRPARSDRVVAVLQKEAAAWLIRATKTPPDADSSPEVREAVAQFVKTSGLAPAQLAKLLASPQAVQQELMRDDRAYSGKMEKVGALAIATLDVELKAHEEFGRACGAVGGTLTQTEEGRRCDWKELENSMLGSPAFASYRALKAEADRNEAQIKTLEAEGVALVQALNAKEKTFSDALKLSKVLSAHATDTDLDAILAAVLKDTSQLQISGSIRTPSVVLSKNTIDIFSVGGHNISLTPTRIPDAPLRIGQPVPKPPDTAAVARPIEDALLTKPRKGSLLEEMRSQAEASLASPERIVQVLERAKTCECDALVVQDEDGGIVFVRNMPPPAQRPIFGKSGLIDALAGPPKPAVVVYENFGDGVPEGITRSTELASGRPRGAALDDMWKNLAAAFEPERPNGEGIQVVVRRTGKAPETLHIDSGVSISHTVPWRNGQVEVPAATRWEDAFGPENALDPTKRDGIIVRLGAATQPSASILGISVEVPAAIRPGISARLAAIVRNWIASRPAQSSPWIDGIVDLRSTIRKQLQPKDLEFFYSRNAKRIRAAELLEIPVRRKAG